MGVTWSGLRQAYVTCPSPPDFPKSDPLPAFVEAIDVNNSLKGVVCAGLSLVPEAGAILSGALKTLWPDTSKPTLKWDDIKEGVKTIAQGLIQEHDAQDLRNRTEGLMKLLHKYKETSYGTKQKEDFLDDLLSWFNANQPWYLNNEEPWLTMQLFVQMATMHLTILREQAFYWNKVYGPEDKHVDAEKHKKELNDAIADYTNHTDKIRSKCMEWRMSKISRTQWQREGHNP